MARLIDEATGAEIKVGDARTTFRGEAVVVTRITEPHKYASEGKVGVRYGKDGWEQEFYAGVIGAKYVDRADGRA
jgi:hypothetical protein